jgi:hypothetical protein
MKILRIVPIAMLMVAIMTGVAVAQSYPAAPRSALERIPRRYKPTPVIHKVVPHELGCHVETPSGELTKVDCLSAKEIAKFPPPDRCSGADGDAACGMQSTVTPVQQAFGINSVPITEAFLEDTLLEYSSSTDSRYGQGGYSLQLNTNWFQSNPTTTGWVQFVYQDFISSARFCVWNIHWPTNSNPTTYSPVCTGMQSIPLTANTQFTVGGFVCAGSCTYFRPGGTAGPAVLWGWVHWSVLDANGNVCASCASGTVWATTQDTLGLASNWLQTSGSILGASNSKLTFAPFAVVRNSLGATSCSIPLSNGWTCDTPQLNGQYADHAGWVTAEANNLYYAPNPNWFIPQLPQSDLDCENGFCALTDYEIYPQ